MPRILFVALPIGLVIAVTALAQTPTATPVPVVAGPIDFNRDIRPILFNNCVACHGPDEKERKAKLRLDTREGAAASGVIVPGKPDESDLLKRIVSTEADEVMPPPKSGKKLTPKEIGLLREWVKQGGNYAAHWAYQKPTRPALPKVSNPSWPKNGIDHFILAKLDHEKLKPSPEADRYSLARRVALDLTGLPPTVQEVDEFVKDTSPGAYERFVDRQLAKPGFGEHWARMWLDLARYADSAGYADDPARTIWAYRDYVIKSFNANKPFDQFTIEQLAGDLLSNPTEEQLTATAFHRNTLTNNEGGTNDEEFRNVAVVDRVNTTMAVWMGTSMACAQCHTHKYDPITQAEYFRFLAFLNNTEDADRGNEAPLLEIFTDEQKRQKIESEQELTALQTKLKTPPASVLAGLPKWEAAYKAASAKWVTAKPTSVKAISGGKATIADDGTITVPGEPNTDTTTIELPLTEPKLSAIRLETIPLAAGKGAGRTNGNFVITGVKAAILPPKTALPQGRFVRITQPGKDQFLMLAEVQVFAGTENIAPKGVAKQSSTDFEGDAKRANDGNTEGHYFRGNSVSHTARENNPWWEVDLKATTPVDRIAIWRRTDGGGERLTNFTVELLGEDRKPVWTTTVKENPNPSKSLDLGGARPVTLTAAFADYSQPSFEPGNVLNNPQPKQKGWAVGGSIELPHTLTVATASPVDVPAGSKLLVTLEQNASFPKHTLSKFRLSTTAEPSAAPLAATPADVVAILSVEPPKRTDVQKKRLADFYHTVAPELQADRDRLAAVQKSLAELKPATTVPIFRELAPTARRVTKLQYRGNFLDTGDVLTEGTPIAFHPMPKDAALNRLGMAKWLMHDDNPLTARVIANRFWEGIFGIGLVRTSEEFGAQGELPTHPELLDWLATELLREKWNVKQFLKLLVTSAAYQQTSRITPEMQERDPDNRLLAHGPRFRLSAETVRDQALAVSGLLSAKMYGPSVKPPQPAFGLSAAFGRSMDWQTSAGEDKFRRGIYTEWRRTNPYPSMTAFDAPSRESCTIRRLSSNTPMQALVTLNDPVYIEAAQSLARTMVATKGTPAEKLTTGFRACLLRPPSDKEMSRLVKLYDDAKAEYAKDPVKAAKMATDPIGPVPAGADVADLAAWTVVGNVLLNLDEMFMKR